MSPTRPRTYRRAFGHYTISTVTVMEMVDGYRSNQASRQLQAFLTALSSQEVLAFEQPIAELAGDIASGLRRIGQRIGPTDTMIAATALYHGLELVTGNTRHFSRVQQLGYLLTLVNWRT